MEGYIGEIRLFAANFSPRNWAYCNGGLIAISSNTALFAILGTTYGGNGIQTFALPNLIGRTAVGAGHGAGLSYYDAGEMGGTNTTTLLSSNLPAHSHPATATVAAPAYSDEGDTDSPTNHVLAAKSGMYSTEAPDTSLSSYQSTFTTNITGSNYPINITQPLQATNYIICMYGIFPSRN
ncbi:hypothetical protein Q763_11505 [Flavobacterium beibuense F44-8]|uniref:Phage tail collar domain-containing protein n=1 Tax=Flavobacterium beibuense F44-8 TaxID=1406840 RepID=A0A0A2LM65_9FLAO|nr:tail fiber protein [Flavobacterium beibuense]KGO80273.1 hypothetical protein Q763_11505 [Flavobacterium beibuense F44-8]